MIHRDIKLENILVRGNKQPAICDFGISRDESLGAWETTTQARSHILSSRLLVNIAQVTTGGVKGTEGYIAPEVLEGMKASQESHI